MNFSKKLLMVRPASFGSNPETLDSNAFQSDDGEDLKTVSSRALEEFDQMSDKIKNHDFDLMILNEPHLENSTDSVFPNNWFSTHENGTLILYPMFSKFRRRERRENFIKVIQKIGEYDLKLDLTSKENKNIFLEGTGSIVFDHESKIGYCCESVRSDKSLFEDLMQYLNYKGIYFNAQDDKGIPIYHTNVMMAIGNKKAVICSNCIVNSNRDVILKSLKDSSIDLVDISLDQMNQFAGNILFALNKKDKPFWLMSERAYKSLEANQIDALKQDAEIISIAIPTIEKYGGGSVRCMLAELY